MSLISDIVVYTDTRTGDTRGPLAAPSRQDCGAKRRGYLRDGQLRRTHVP